MNMKKLYFGLVSLISIIAIAISLGIVLSNLGKLVLISDEEYLANNYWYTHNCKDKASRKACGLPIYDKNNPAYSNYQKCISNLSANPKYKEAFKNCEEKEKERILLRRYYNLKISLIGAFSTFVVFLVLFIFHYSKFKKLD